MKKQKNEKIEQVSERSYCAQDYLTYEHMKITRNQEKIYKVLMEIRDTLKKGD